MLYTLSNLSQTPFSAKAAANSIPSKPLLSGLLGVGAAQAMLEKVSLIVYSKR